MMEWQPIETAPRDCDIIVKAGGRSYSPVSWVESGQVSKDGFWCLWFPDLNNPMHEIKATYWMPLPKPPEGRAS